MQSPTSRPASAWSSSTPNPARRCTPAPEGPTAPSSNNGTSSRRCSKPAGSRPVDNRPGGATWIIDNRSTINVPMTAGRPATTTSILTAGGTTCSNITPTGPQGDNPTEQFTGKAPPGTRTSTNPGNSPCPASSCNPNTLHEPPSASPTRNIGTSAANHSRPTNPRPPTSMPSK